MAGDTDSEESYPCEWAGVYAKSTYLLLHFAVNLTTSFFLSLKISLALSTLRLSIFSFVSNVFVIVVAAFYGSYLKP